MPNNGYTRDEWGNLYDASGNKLVAPEPSLWDSLHNIAMSPVNMAIGAVTGPYEAAKWLFGPEGHFAEGPDPLAQGTDSHNAQAANGLLLAMTGGNAFNPLAEIPQGSLGMFAGRYAKTADIAALSKAEDMASSGASRDDIWNNTGWFQGADGKWRFEIDDSQAKLSSWRRNGPLSQVLKHEDLRQAYPSVADIPTSVMSVRGSLGGSSGGYADAGSNAFTRLFNRGSITYSPWLEGFNGPEAVTPTLLHEAQHAIQQREGFARGASGQEYSYRADGLEPGSRFYHAKQAVTQYADAMMARDGLGQRPDWRGAAPEDFLRLMNDGFAWDKVRKGYEDRAYNELNDQAYSRSAGEVEARNVQNRQFMTPEERRATPPWLTQDIPDEKQILQSWGQRSPLPSQPEKSVTPRGNDPNPPWMNPVYGEVLPPAPVAQTASDALASSFHARPIIDGDLLADNAEAERVLGPTVWENTNPSASGFVDGSGNFMSRQQASASLRELPGLRVGDEAHYDDLNHAKRDYPDFFSDQKPSIPGTILSGAESLPMDAASRMARAKEQGFDIDTPLFHGTQKKFDAFQPSDGGSYGPGVYVTSNVDHANHFANNDWNAPPGEVLNLYGKGPFATFDDVPKTVTDRPWYKDMFGTEGTPASRASDWARENGYSGFKNGENSVVFDPSDLRSVDAAFDPANIGKNGLLLSDTRPSLLGSAIQGAESPQLRTLYHSTNAPPFDKFDNNFTDEVGFHFGNRLTANDRAFIKSGGNWWDYFRNYRTMPVEADIRNPLYLDHDLGHFDAQNLANNLWQKGEMSFDDAVNLRRDVPDDKAAIRQQNDLMRQWLIDKGYDAVAYPNAYEGNGDLSYMLLNTGNVRDPKTGKVVYSGGGLLPFGQQNDQER